MQTSRLNQLMEMLKEEPKDSFLKYAIATEYVKLNELEKALGFYIELLTENENYVGTYYHLGKLYELLNDKKKAEETYQKGMKIAREMGDNHAHSELQAVFNSLKGLDYEDD